MFRAPPSRSPGARARLFQTLLPGILGAALGYAVGKFEGVSELGSIMLPLYALMGAIGGILAYRIGLLVKEIISDFRSG
jgi:hypothetical protein